MREQLALIQDGENANYSSVYRIMKKNELLHKAKRYSSGITKEDAAAQKAENLIKRNFTANEPNKKWLTDITEVPCSDGKLYVAQIMDCFNGEIVELAMEAELCVQAFENACTYQSARDDTSLG